MFMGLRRCAGADLAEAEARFWCRCNAKFWC